jgi:hypothetical protein
MMPMPGKEAKMLSIQPTSTPAAYTQSQSTQTDQTSERPARNTPQAPTVEVSSSAALLFNALADLILGGSGSSQDTTSATTAPQGQADGDENANGMEVNDGDADDVPQGAMLQFSDVGTYSFGGRTA